MTATATPSAETFHWWMHPIDHRAAYGGEVGVNGHMYKAGEFLPYYIPRIEMPQIPDDCHDDLIKYMASLGIDAETVVTSPELFFNHQRVKLDPAKVKTISPESMAVPIFASYDQIVIDGNHRWALHRHFRRPLSAIVFQASFIDCVASIMTYPKVFHVDGER